MRDNAQEVAMAAHREVDDEDVVETVTVRFSVGKDGSMHGDIVYDCPNKRRSKIVRVARSWEGPAPKDGEELRVRVVHETKLHDPHRGTLFVERILPTIVEGRHWFGGLLAKCPSCGQLSVPMWNKSPGVGIPFISRRLRGRTSCEACGTLCVIPD